MPALPHYRLLSRGSGRRPVSRRLALDAGRARPFEAAEWHRCLVLVEQGQLQLQWENGATLTFGPGDVLYLASLGLVALRAVGTTPAQLLLVRR